MQLAADGVWDNLIRQVQQRWRQRWADFARRDLQLCEAIRSSVGAQKEHASTVGLWSGLHDQLSTSEKRARSVHWLARSRQRRGEESLSDFYQRLIHRSARRTSITGNEQPTVKSISLQVLG